MSLTAAGAANMITVINIEEHRAFLHAAIRSPNVIGAVAPSSRSLAAQLASVVPGTGAPTVVELGPGTGSVSVVIRRQLPSAGRQLAVECDPDMLAYLHHEQPWLTVLPGDAANLDHILAEVHLHQINAVISGLPWSIFAAARQEQILDAICRVVAPDGAFTTFGYLHALRMSGARRFRALLGSRFEEVLTTRAVWCNLPPALVYVCRRPRRPPTR